MPHITLETFNLENATPSELEARRRALTAEMQRYPKGYDDPELPDAMLHELAAITISLRRKNARPPKVASTKSKIKATMDDLI